MASWSSSGATAPSRAAAATRRVCSDSGIPFQQRQRFLPGMALHQKIGEGDDGLGVAGLDLQCGAQAVFAAFGDQSCQSLLLLGRAQRIDELLHDVLGLGTDEPVDDLSVAHRVDRGDRLHLERLGDRRVLVGVHLGEHDIAAGGVDHLLEDGAERLARPAPLRPQVDHHRDAGRTVDHFGLEVGIGDIDGHAAHDTGVRRGVRWPGRGACGAGLGTAGQVTTPSDTVAVMTSTADEPTAVPGDPDGIHVDHVTSWLTEHVEGAEAPFRFDAIAGGHSNLTYRVTGGDGTAFVLRRPPLGHVLASAHDMGREHRIIDALQDSAVPVAPSLGYCDDVSVTGAPFYVMGFVDGHVLRDRETAEAVLDPAARRTASESIVDTMAAIHAVDLDAIGLDGLGKHDGYIARQLKRWYGQWNAQKTRDIAAVDEVHDELMSRIPEQGPAALVHGDYRLDNCMVSDGGDVIAVLDWEIATLGDPLADVGLLQVYWTGPGDEASAWTGSATTADGFLDRAEMSARYAAASGRDLRDLPFYTAFAYWKLACILEGVYARYLGGALGQRDPAELAPFVEQVDGASARAREIVDGWR